MKYRIALFACFTTTADSFTLLPASSALISSSYNFHRTPKTSSSSSCLYAALKNENEKGTTTLHFKGKQVFRSKPVPLDSFSSIEAFFIKESDELRKLLLGGSGNNSAKILSQAESIAMQDDWLERARKSGGDLPSPDKGDIVCRVNTGGMNFAGLNIQSDAMIGTKLVTPNTTGGATSPEFQLTFIKDRQNVTGPRFLVFIFNKLTGQDGKKSEHGDGDGANEQAVTSFTRFFAERSSETEATFIIETSLDIAVKFPSLLLKILPVSKEKAEEQGSASVIKTLVRDTTASLERIADYYKLVSVVQHDSASIKD